MVAIIAQNLNGLRKMAEILKMVELERFKELSAVPEVVVGFYFTPI